jgi:hypothetical protein
MADQPQNLKNHAKYYPIWHFVAVPILLANVIVHARRAMTARTWETHWDMVVAIGILCGAWAARGMALSVQNRVIRLEMRLRLRDVLPAALQGRIMELSTSQLIGLRFASDAELPELVTRCLSGELKNGRAVKPEIKNWQADHLRA